MGRVIIETRYGGGYEGGAWAAFASEAIPEEAQGEDVECRTWWEAPTVAAGVGATPEEALGMLDRVVRACKHPQSNRQAVPAGFTCSYCDLLVIPSSGTVEDLLAVVQQWASIGHLNLWVPNTLSFNGEPIEHTVAMRLVSDAAATGGLVLKGSTEEDGGRHLRFRRR
jgi:hypothetical protein